MFRGGGRSSGGDGRRGGCGVMIPLLGLHTASEYYRLERKPPVTAGLLVANTLIYLRPGVLHRILPTLDQVSFNPHLILKYGHLRRFFMSPFYHLGEPHLVYNMLSLLWKGVQLENSMGSVEFASMVAALVGMSQGITLLMSKSLLLFLDYERPYYQYSVGFSGVLFAMKVVLNEQSDNYTSVYGVLVPSKYAAWAELILIQMFVPDSSFLGHLGGILAGLLYLRLKSSYRGPDPLKSFFRGITDLLSWPLKFVRNLYRRNQRGRTVGRGSIAGRNRTGGISAGGGSWRCSTCTFANTQGLSSCEMCGTGRGRGGNENVSSAVRSHTNDNNRSGNLSLEELRGNENVSPAGGRGGNENVSSAVRSRSNDDDNRSGNFSLEELRSRSNVNNRSGNLSLEELRRRRIERFGG